MAEDLNTPYEAGYDSVISGANTTNCNFKWFNTPEDTQEWERGVSEAKQSKEANDEVR